jgi:hypothetical protein
VYHLSFFTDYVLLIIPLTTMLRKIAGLLLMVVVSATAARSLSTYFLFTRTTARFPDVFMDARPAFAASDTPKMRVKQLVTAATAPSALLPSTSNTRYRFFSLKLGNKLVICHNKEDTRLLLSHSVLGNCFPI